MTAGRGGRIPGPVHATDRPRARELALLLRGFRDRAALEYRDLSARTGRPGAPGYRGASTLSRAASGATVPPAATVAAFARAAGRDGEPPGAAEVRVEQALSAHRAAAAEALLAAAPSPTARRVFTPVRPDRIRTPAALARALVRQRLQAGQPSLTALQDATAAAGRRVPRSRVARILAGTLLPTAAELQALLTALHTTPAEDRARWHDALQHIQDRLHPQPAQRWYGCADDHPAVQAQRERDERDEQIKRRTGAVRDDESWEEYKEREAAEREGWDWDEIQILRAGEEATNDW